MLLVKSLPLELRGVANKQTKKGVTYYVLNVETDDGTPYALYCPKSDCLPLGLRKGDTICVTMEVIVYNGTERLIVRHVEKEVE